MSRSVEKTPEQQRRAHALFAEAIDIPESDREQFLANACGEEKWLRAEVKALLRSLDEAGEFLEESPATDMARALMQATGPKPLETGQTVGDFRIVRALGKGSFATVYLAHQLSLDRRVALKVTPNVGREARNMAHVEHDHIVKVFSETIDVTLGCRWLCMQWVPGLTLEATLALMEKKREGGAGAVVDGAAILEVIDAAAGDDAVVTPAALKDRERMARFNAVEAAVWMAARLADALAYAHTKGVLHLDVKPANILLSVLGRPMLTDFNVAADRRAAEDWLLGGTVRYMPPEQQRLFQEEGSDAARAAVDERSDIFALGVVLEEMVRRLTGGTVEASGVPCLGEVVARCRRPDPVERFSRADEVARALEGCLERHQIEHALPPPGPIARFTERSPAFAMVLFALGPHLLGSAVNISYNATHIVADLSDRQRREFLSLCIVYNLIIYPICILLSYRLLRPMVRLLRNPGPSSRQDGRTLDERGRRVLMLPLGFVFVSTLGWMPGAIFFPLLIHLKEGPLPASAFGHFFISFTVSWLVASAYAFLYTEFVVFRLLYPRLCLGTVGVRDRARRQLVGIASGLRTLHYTAGFAPLVGAALIVFIGPDPSRYQSYRLLVTMLIGAGIVGLLFAIRGSTLIAQTVGALTSHEDNR